MTRPYRLGKRAGQAANTRQRIIDAARDLIVEGGVGTASLDAVARRAASTRTTIYDRFWASGHALFAQVKGLALVDADIAGINAIKEGVRLGHMTNLVSRLADEGCLGAGRSKRNAVATLLFVTSFETFDQLHRRSGMREDMVAAALVDMASRELLG